MEAKRAEGAVWAWVAELSWWMVWSF